MSAICKTINCVLLIPTLLLAMGGAYLVFQTKRQVEHVQEALPKELILPSFEEVRAYAEGTHALLEARFTSWAQAHNKKYSTEAERKKRLGLFAASARMVEEHNSKIPAGSNSYRLGLNEFADMSDSEFFEMYKLNSKVGAQECSATHRKNNLKKAETVRPADLPQSIDWRQKGIVGPVKNQGQCGSCWSFSTTGTLEAHYKKKTGRYVSLSEQQLLDCAGNYNNHGCSGGLPSNAFQYILENGGLNTERAYPYEARSEGTTCRFKKWGVGARIKAVHNITQFDETELEVAVGTAGPVSIAYQVANDFRLYAGGVYDSAVCKNQPQDVNHAVVAVGYGTTENGVKYWIAKNSWGTGWGVEGGYFYIKRGVNMCGVAVCASYPIV